MPNRVRGENNLVDLGFVKARDPDGFVKCGPVALVAVREDAADASEVGQSRSEGLSIGKCGLRFGAQIGEPPFSEPAGRGDLFEPCSDQCWLDVLVEERSVFGDLAVAVSEFAFEALPCRRFVGVVVGLEQQIECGFEARGGEQAIEPVVDLAE